VGAVTDENALEEIEDIAKVFAYEQYMKDYTSFFQKQHITKKRYDDKKIMENNRFVQPAQARVLVKGLC
jgi:hypothetical protein